MKTIYFDMDGVLADFVGHRRTWLSRNPDKSEGDFEYAQDIFRDIPPIDGAIEAVQLLNKSFDIYICSTVPWKNTSGASGKIAWIKKHFGEGKENPFYKKVILTHNKHLNVGDYLIDDRPKNGAEQFSGEWIQFGSRKFPNWDVVTKYLLQSTK